jgi:hypothetical protein
MHSEADLHLQRWYVTEHVIDDIEMRERIYVVNFRYLLIVSTHTKDDLVTLERQQKQLAACQR